MRRWTTCLLAGALVASDARKIRWYMNLQELSVNGSGLATIDANRDAFTGVYPCCGIWQVDDEGHVSNKTEDAAGLLSIAAQLHARNLDVLPTIAITEAAILNQTGLLAIDRLVELVIAYGMDGLMCDYEPDNDYTQEHADAGMWRR